MNKVSKALTNLAENVEAARLSTRLATLDLDCVKEFDWEFFAWKFAPSEELRQFYREMEFRQLLDELPGKTVEQRTTRYETIVDRAGLERVAAAIAATGEASIDTETDDLDPFTARLVGISMAWERDQAVYVPIGHQGGGRQLALEDVRAVLGPLLANPAITWVAHNWGFDYSILLMAGLPVARLGGDTMIAAYLLNPERPGTLKLKELAVTHLGIQMTQISELIGQGDDMVTMAMVDVEQTSQYACQDADVTLQLHRDLYAALGEAEMTGLYHEVELPLVKVLAGMELEGVRIDREYLRGLSAQAEGELARLTTEIHALAGRPFNINSTKQLAELLFVELNLPSGKKGKSGALSTDVTVLESLQDKHPLPAKLLEYRSVEKLKNTYIDPLPGMVKLKTGRVHTSYNQTVAATGRLSSSNPNLQNIPVRTEAGRAIRRGFVAREPGWLLLAADYSQIELRILAHLSQDPALIEAFTTGSDIHALTASKMFHVPLAEVTSQQRTSAKAINFGIIYGMSDFRLSQDLKIRKDEAKQFIAEYFRVYAGVKAFIDNTIAQAKRDRFVTTMLGRRRFLPDINSPNFNNRSAAERIAVNTPIQGTSADMIKVAMLRVAARLQSEGLAARMILQVHDELIFDTPAAEVPALTELVQAEMGGALKLSVPLKVGVEVGENWAEC